MTGESLAGSLGDGLEKREVVRCGRDGDMTHGGREDREFGLDVDPSAIPAQEGVDSVGVTQVVDAGDAAVGRADVGATEEVLHTPTEARTGIGPQPSAAIHEKRRGRGVRQTLANS
jgi:hypothetical protein